MNAYSERILVLSLLSCVFSRTFLSGGIGAPIFSAFSRILPRVYLKSRNYRLFLQAQPDYALKILGIRKGFLRLFALHPACVCEISVIFFVFRYTLGQHRTIPALRLKHLSGSCGTASALPKCSIRHPVLSALLAWHLPHLARRIGT